MPSHERLRQDARTATAPVPLPPGLRRSTARPDKRQPRPNAAYCSNERAQGLRPMSYGIEWFDALSPEAQSGTLRFLAHYCVQAGAVTEDGPEGVRRAGLRPTHTPAVLITRGRIDQQTGQDRPARASVRASEGVPAADRGCSRTPTSGAASATVPTGAATGGTGCPALTDSLGGCLRTARAAGSSSLCAVAMGWWLPLPPPTRRGR